MPAPVVGPPAPQPEDPTTTSGQTWLTEVTHFGTAVLILLALLLLVAVLTERSAHHRISPAA